MALSRAARSQTAAPCARALDERTLAAATKLKVQSEAICTSYAQCYEAKKNAYTDLVTYTQSQADKHWHEWQSANAASDATENVRRKNNTPCGCELQILGPIDL